MAPSTPLSKEYPKWLYKRGFAAALAKTVEAEAGLRAKGYDHQYHDPTPLEVPIVAHAHTPGTPGTVPTSTMDQLLEDQKAKFDAAWAKKCEELAASKKAHDQLVIDSDAVKAKHDKLVAEHKALVDEHAALVAKMAAAAKPAEAPKAAPVVPPVAEKK
jgi:hypothetical protein